MKPFLKWAGGKFRLLPRIRERLPAGQRLVEPFVGSAAVWLNTEYSTALLADVNRDLIGCYQTLQRRGAAFIDDCRQYFVPENNQSQQYYRLRARFNATLDAWERAALFVYLNRHGYNGLCRYNAAGAFNVPFGRYRRPYFPEAEMYAFWEKAQRATFLCQDFRTVFSTLHGGDVVYCDPPYVPLSRTANFTDYTAGGFGQSDHRDLAELAEQWGVSGIPVLVSNHCTPFTEAAYRRAAVIRFGVRRFISCDGANRSIAEEMLALFAPAG